MPFDARTAFTFASSFMSMACVACRSKLWIKGDAGQSFLSGTLSCSCQMSDFSLLLIMSSSLSAGIASATSSIQSLLGPGADGAEEMMGSSPRVTSKHNNYERKAPQPLHLANKHYHIPSSLLLLDTSPADIG